MRNNASFVIFVCFVGKRLSSFTRKKNGEGRALADFGFEADGAAVFSDDGGDDAESEPRTLATGLGCKEGGEDALLILF